MFLHSLLREMVSQSDAQHLRLLLAGATAADLALYDHLPQVLTQAIADPRRIVLALKWLRNEMDRRYQILRDQSVRDISGYHRAVLAPVLAAAATRTGEPLPQAMPYIVLVIDEIADVLRTHRRETEAALLPILQSGRGAGIHVIIATSSTNSKVIGAELRAHLSTRMAFADATQGQKFTLGIRTAQLIRQPAQMLYRAIGADEPQRIDVPKVSADMLQAMMAESRLHRADTVPDERISGNEIFYSVQAEHFEDEDELYLEAKRAVVEAGQASTSFLQRKLGIGYARAAKLMDMLEEGGVLGPVDGPKPRKVLIVE